MSDQLVLIAGCSGGVGTTTVAALLFAAWGPDRAPRLEDHSGGSLGARLSGGDEVTSLDERLVLVDLGAHAAGELLERMREPQTLAVVVGFDTPIGQQAARRVLLGIREQHGAGGLARTLVVLTGCAGVRRGRGAEALRNEFGHGRVVTVPRDRALAAGGRIPLTRLSAATRRAQADLLRALRGLLTSYAHAGAR